MTGLNLETFLRILRADLGAWASLGVVAVVLGVMTWTSWGSKRALRKCLFLSIAAHVGLVVYGGSSPELRRALRLDPTDRLEPRSDRPVRITPVEAERSTTGPGGKPSRRVADWDLDKEALSVADPARQVAPPMPSPMASLARNEPEAAATPSASPDIPTPEPRLAAPVRSAVSLAPEPPPSVAEADPSEVAAPVAPSVVAASTEPPPVSIPRPRPRPGLTDAGPARSMPARSEAPIPGFPQPPRLDLVAPRVAVADLGTPASPGASKPEDATVAAEDLDPGPPTTPSPLVVPSPADASPAPAVRRALRPAREVASATPLPTPSRLADAASMPPALARVAPAGPAGAPATTKAVTRRSISDVPPVYRSRLDPNRTALAQRAGASAASEQAVERALDWLARHQDAADGRWDGGTAKYRDGTVAPDDDSFLIHCPAGEICFGECYYAEADTALTGLSLLAYLGAGYTHLDGKYAPVVARGLEFLLKSQKADGDLRGSSLAVGMYCHSMATLAICEAYALTGDSRLRSPVEKAVGFLVRSRAVDGLAWRYAPGAPSGDTSILGWAVMALKSARTVGIPIPPETQAGVLGWLKRVSKGRDGGLACYNFEAAGTNPTPTMTAEAWACRQFLEVGGPGPSSEEAAGYLLQNRSDRGEFNIYYLYYGTLSMYQHGGDAWSTWNARVRDEVVRRQRAKGHMAGSWDPDDSPYGPKGGRIYGTALATLTLEVYYRFLRLYEPAPSAPLAPRPADPSTRRTGLGTIPPGR
jgi:hypothetical protein